MPKTKDGGFILDETKMETPRYQLNMTKEQAKEKKNTDGKGCDKPKGNKK